jgi:phage terminase Nu1 subunit (DNA packaging protein)
MSTSPDYPASFFARLFNVTERRIQQLAKDSVIPKSARGKYPLIGTIQGYVKYLQDRSLGNVSPSDGDLNAERLRLTRAQADNMEIKNEIARGQTAPIELITWVLSKVAGEVAGEIDSIPLNVRRKHPSMNAQVIEDIKRHCVKAQNAVSRVDEILETALNDYIDQLNQN